MRIAMRHAVSAVALLVLSMTGCTSIGERDTLAAYEAAQRDLHRSNDGDVQHVSYDQTVGDQRLSIDDFSPDNLAENIKSWTGRGPNPDVAKQLYAEAQAAYRQANAQRAANPQVTAPFIAVAEAYEDAAARWPNSTLEHDALFMAAESHFFADRYPQAEEAYERLLKKYPNSKHMDRIQPRRFAIANYWLGVDDADPSFFYEVNVSDGSRPRLDTFGHAVRVFERIRLDDPTGKLADDATLALGNAFFSRGKFLRADEYYTDLRKTFPSSEHQFLAHFLGLKSKLLSYQGPDYSANSLKEAEKLLKQLRRQFPMEAEREREYIARAGAEVRYRLAEREWELAEHYFRRSEYGAARFHYQDLMNEYSDTPFAQRSEARLRETGGLPSIPPQRFGWLVNLFPEDEVAVPLMASDPSSSPRR